MRRVAIVLAAAAGLCLAYVLAHWTLIELGREVVVLRTQNADGSWRESRLWIVDDGGASWLHGGDSEWMRNLEARPLVEIERAGETHRYRASALPGPHPRIDELLRTKYGVADRWVRFVAPDGASTRVVRLERLDASWRRRQGPGDSSGGQRRRLGSSGLMMPTSLPSGSATTA